MRTLVEDLLEFLPEPDFLAIAGLCLALGVWGDRLVWAVLCCQ